MPRLVLSVSLLFLTAPPALHALEPATLYPRAEAAAAAALAGEGDAALSGLATQLTRGAPTDQEKARALYEWVATNIRYDAESFLAGRARARSASDVLRERVAGCDGYARLFEALAKDAGLEAVTVLGWAKGAGAKPGAFSAQPNHAWNAVKIDGQWRLLDATWGAGGFEGRTWVQRFNPHFFLTSPAEMVLSHFPVDAAWQLLDEPMPLEAWLSITSPRAELFRLGFSHDAVLRALAAEPAVSFVEAFVPSRSSVRVVDAPLAGELAPGAPVSFAFESPDAEQIVLARGRQRVELEHRGREFTTTRALSPGRWRVMARPRGQAVYEVVLDYVVRAS